MSSSFFIYFFFFKDLLQLCVVCVEVFTEVRGIGAGVVSCTMSAGLESSALNP